MKLKRKKIFKRTTKTKRRKIEKNYSKLGFWVKLFKFFKWKMHDIKEMKNNPDLFREFGMTMFCGRQGDGKSVAMVETLEQLRQRYPKALILTNFGYKHETQPFDSWNDLFNVRNGDYGVIFAIDEIQNEFSTTSSKNFPETLLSEITQQRKQKIKILSTSQVFKRVAKPLREQTYEVVECKTLMGRWTFAKCFDADEYNDVVDSSRSVELKQKMRRKWRKNFIQDNTFRELFDSYAKIERMKKLEYVRENKAV